MRQGIIPLMLGTSLVTANPAEAMPPVFSVDGRRLRDLFDKATKGTLTPEEPPLIYKDGIIPDDVFRSLKEDNPSFTRRELGSSEGDVFHVWNDHHHHMSNDELEDGIHAIVYGDNRFHTKGNPPQPDGIGAIVDGKGYNASLRPDNDFTHIYQMNPIKEKKLLKKMRSPVESPDGAVRHRLSYSPEYEESDRLRSKLRLSADGDSMDEPITPLSKEIKKTSLVAAPVSSVDSIPITGLLRQLLLGTRGVMEGAGGVADAVSTPMNWINGKLGGDYQYFKNPGKALADVMGLPTPQSDLEKNFGGLNKAASSALVESAAGGGLARYGAGMTSKFGKFLADSPVLNSTIAGLLGYLSGGRD